MPRIELGLWWEPREPAQADDARRLSRFVSGLPNFDPIYQSWLQSPKANQTVLPVPLDEVDARQFLNEKLGRYDTGGLWPESGSHWRAGHAGSPPYDFRKSSYADTDCRVNAYGIPERINPNRIIMRLSELRPSTERPWRASELRPLMKFAREIWNPAAMYAIFSFYILDLPTIPDRKWAARVRTLEPRIGWITYLPPDLASRASYPPDTLVETLDDGAALVTLCEEPFDKTDAEGLARLHALEAALRPIQS